MNLLMYRGRPIQLIFIFGLYVTSAGACQSTMQRQLRQRFNSALITDSCFIDEDPDLQSPVIFVFSF